MMLCSHWFLIWCQYSCKSSHGWRLASELKVILDIYRLPILVGSFWPSLLSKKVWGKTPKYSVSHQERLSSVAVYGFWNSHWVTHPQFSPLYLQYGIISSVQRGTGLISHRYQVVVINLISHNIFTLLIGEWAVFMALCRGKVTEKTLCYHCVLIWVKCREYAVLSFIFLFISPWSNKACRQDVLGLPCPSLKVNGHLIFSLVFAGIGARQPFPQSCASVISCTIASVDSHWDGIRDDLRFWSFISVAAGIQDVDGFRNIISDVWVPGIPGQTNQK